MRCGCRSTSWRIRRTVRGLIASTMPSATAWRARSSLVQWVMCSPSATGSRQASSTIWAALEGGKSGRGARIAPRRSASSPPARSLVAAAGPPDGGRVALQAVGDGLAAFASGDGQDDAGMLDLEPGEGITPSDPPQDPIIGRCDGQGTRSSAAHEAPRSLVMEFAIQHRSGLEFVASIAAGDTQGLRRHNPGVGIMTVFRPRRLRRAGSRRSF